MAGKEGGGDYLRSVKEMGEREGYEGVYLGRGNGFEKEEGVVFVNKGGYWWFVMCGEWGYVGQCGDCEIWMSYEG
ncbi:hypothetical protein, partial [Bacillus velezensis]|uniref:hypothetical protein n=1 Tax=Bacillus velezensis TaxID=492670 RepID=UPI0037BE5B73